MTINRLDHFWISLLQKNNNIDNIDESGHKVFFKHFLILSQGNAEVERKFSVNKECIVKNMTEEPLVAIRTVIDAVRYYGHVETVLITKSLMLYSKNARSKYMTKGR